MLVFSWFKILEDKKRTQASIRKKLMLMMMIGMVLLYFEILVWIKSVKNNRLNKKVCIVSTSKKFNSNSKKDTTSAFIANSGMNK